MVQKPYIIKNKQTINSIKKIYRRIKLKKKTTKDINIFPFLSKPVSVRTKLKMP